MATGSSTSKRGFASMDGDRQREIASKGGKSVPAEKRSFSQIVSSHQRQAAKADRLPAIPGAFKSSFRIIPKKGPPHRPLFVW